MPLHLIKTYLKIKSDSGSKKIQVEEERKGVEISSAALESEGRSGWIVHTDVVLIGTYDP